MRNNKITPAIPAIRTIAKKNSHSLGSEGDLDNIVTVPSTKVLSDGFTSLGSGAEAVILYEPGLTESVIHTKETVSFADGASPVTC